MYVRPSLIVPGDAATTASNIMASEWLYRLGFERSNHVNVFSFVAPTFIRFTQTSWQSHALLMVLFVFVSVPIAMLNTLNNFAFMLLFSGADYLTVFTSGQLQAKRMLFLNLYDNGYLIAEIFFGAWLLPLGYLAYKSGYFPRILGVLLIIGGFAQLIDTFRGFLFPSYEGIILTVLKVFGFSEILFCLWLLVKGVNVEQWEKRALESA